MQDGRDPLGHAWNIADHQCRTRCSFQRYRRCSHLHANLRQVTAAKNGPAGRILPAIVFALQAGRFFDKNGISGAFAAIFLWCSHPIALMIRASYLENLMAREQAAAMVQDSSFASDEALLR